MMLQDGSMFEELVAKDKGLAAKVRDFVLDYLGKLSSAITVQHAEATELGKYVKDQQALWNKALKGALRNGRAVTESRQTGEQKFSIGRTRLLPIGKQLSEYRKGQFNQYDEFYFGATPRSIAASGFDAIPLAMSQSDFAKSKRQKHNVPDRVWKKVPTILADPILAFEYGDRAGILAKDIDADGKPLVIGLQKNVDINSETVNRVKTAFGFEKESGWVESLLNRGAAVRVYDIEQANSFLDDIGYKAEYPENVRSGEIVTLIRSEVKQFSRVEASAEIKTEDGTAFYDDVQNGERMQFSRVDDPQTLAFLNGQETIKTYKSMQLVDGKLYPPMAAVVGGKQVQHSELGVWEQADEHPELIKRDKNGKLKWNLNKGKGQGSVAAAYNPYMHSSNLVLNDQFTGAYKRNLVTVECEIPASELTSGYKAEYAKDSVGMLSWHTGPVASALKGNQRMVYLSRWLKPVRILSDAEVAAEYAKLLEGTGVQVPDNVVPASLLKALEEAGVPIDRTGIAKQEGSGKQRFSMADVVEQTDKLVAVHNVTEEKLLGALKLGGLPVPSIAIVKARSGHSNYGPISLVFNRESIDPKTNRKNKVYGADAWTPMMRDVEYQVNLDRAFQAESTISELSKQIAGGIFSSSSVIQQYGIHDVSALDAEGLLRKIAATDAAKAAYAAANGIQIETVYRQKEFSSYGNAVLQRYIDRIGEDKLRQLEEQLESGNWELSEADLHELQDVLREEFLARANKPALAEKRAAIIATNDRYVKFINSAYQFLQSNGETTNEIDRLATEENLEKAVSSKDVIEWLQPQMEGVIGEPGIRNERDLFTPSGSRRSFWQTHDTYDLANIVKAMTRGNSRGAGIHLGATHLQSITATDYSNLEDVRRDSGRLRRTSEEEYSAAVSAVDEQLEELVNAIAAYNGDSSYSAKEIIGEVLIEAARGNRSAAGIRQAFKRLSEYSLSEELAKQVQAAYDAAANLPTEYFEAKPQRAVGFDEVAAAIVPSDIDSNVRSQLEERGVPVVEYQRANEQERLERLNSVEGAQFSRDDNGNVVVNGDVNPEKIFSTLEAIYNDEVGVNFTFPILKHTPQVYRDWCDHADRSFVMSAKKARDAMKIGKGHKHGLKPRGLMSVINNLYRPDYIIEEHSDEHEGHHVAIFMDASGEVVAAVDIGNWRESTGAIDGEEGFYNTLITAYNELLPGMEKEFKSFSEYIESLFMSPNKVVYDRAVNGEYEAPEDVALSDPLLRSSSGTSSDDILSDEDGKSKNKSQDLYDFPEWNVEDGDGQLSREDVKPGELAAKLRESERALAAVEKAHTVALQQLEYWREQSRIRKGSAGRGRVRAE